MNPFKIKICGVTCTTDATAAVDAGADAIGLNFYERSLRSVAAPDALEIVTALPDSVSKVGVFVNHSAESILEIASHLQLTAIQLHGDETPDMIGLLNGFPVIRALRISDEKPSAVETVQSQIDLWCDHGVSGILIDKALGNSYGGTGSSFDWKLVDLLKIPVMFILAGGLRPENVAEAVLTAKPDAVDVASGVEGLPSRKDTKLMRQFVASARSAFDSTTS